MHVAAAEVHVGARLLRDEARDDVALVLPELHRLGPDVLHGARDARRRAVHRVGRVRRACVDERVADGALRAVGGRGRRLVPAVAAAVVAVADVAAVAGAGAAERGRLELTLERGDLSLELRDLLGVASLLDLVPASETEGQ